MKRKRARGKKNGSVAQYADTGSNLSSSNAREINHFIIA
jgi:hypothetical protein